ncbi:MAG: ImmA/IrrE family metallo-endopeptidase [Lachnospiraceae bacterium]|nr:ImmA/IrrE family metallo-endopeptidase [Lachnospiraceae bacterium]
MTKRVREPDYSTPIERSLEVLEDAEITSFPVDLKKIFKHYHLIMSLGTYKQFSQRRGISLDEIIEKYGEDGFASMDPVTNRCTVYYNSDSPYKNRIRFTIAHEIGHFFMEHFLEANTSVLRRAEISEKLYKVLENEANCFARNLLCPAPIANKVMLQGQHETEYPGVTYSGPDNTIKRMSAETMPARRISRTFLVTEKAARTRQHFLAEDLNAIEYRGYEVGFLKDIRIRARWICRKCKSPKLSSGFYCQECGSKQFIYDLPGVELPDAIPVMDDGRFEHCPECGNWEFSADASFCRMCGTPLNNQCTKQHHSNHPFAKYCTVCSNETEFNRNGLLTRLLAYRDLYPGGDSMKYEQIKYDEDAMRVLECPRCKNEQFSTFAKYCRICGLDLHNTCEGVQLEDYNGSPYTDQHSNPPNARYCEHCGTPTTYLKMGILKPYDVYLKELAEQEDPFLSIPDDVDLDEGDSTSIASESEDSFPWDNDEVEDEELPF